MVEKMKKQSILIVDDSSFNNALLSDILKDEYQIRTVTNGNAAFDIAFSQEPPALILLDVVMPEIDGYEVCKKLKANDFTKNIPVIFITARVNEEDEIYGFSLGAVDYISKPYNPVIVKARVRTHMELAMYREYLEAISYLDGLTGIPNRRRFDERFELMWNIARREKNVLSVVMMDIDNFKKYNDIYGHQAGDDCLIKVAKELEKTIQRKTDFIGRYGGEEFVCILPNTDKDNAVLVAEQMRQNIMKLNVEHKGSEVSDIVTISLGVASFIPDKESKASDLLELADAALYCSKESGRNKVSINSAQTFR